MSLRAVLIPATLFLTLFAGPCSRDEEDDDDSTDKCSTVTDLFSMASPSAGRVRMNGTFPSDESVLIRYVNDQAETRQIVGAPSADRTMIEFIGLPEGSHSFSIYISCDEENEQVKRGSRTITVLGN